MQDNFLVVRIACICWSCLAQIFRFAHNALPNILRDATYDGISENRRPDVAGGRLLIGRVIA